MARQMAGYMGPFSGTLGTAIGYMWNGKWCMRSRPTAVHNPRTPEQVAHREMFKREVQLAADLRDAVVASMSDMARQMGMTCYNLFVSVNQGAFSLVERANQPSEVVGGVFEVDWQNLRLSMGDVAQVESPRREMKEHNVLEVNYDKGRGYSHDLVRLVVYAPGLKRALMSKPAFRKDKKVTMALPDRFADEELQVWLLVQSPDGRWSESVWVPENEECGMRIAELGVGNEEGRMRIEELGGGEVRSVGGRTAGPPE